MEGLTPLDFFMMIFSNVICARAGQLLAPVRGRPVKFWLIITVFLGIFGLAALVFLPSKRDKLVAP
jgi:hypothetical protein